ncbi:MAG: HlyC/CorC family transporter [Ruminococcaceae bacterium]|nr:HlyC/CorC family transporter [Oscillospiraceae bacterium]
MDTDGNIRTMLHLPGIVAEIAAGVTGEGEALASAAEPPPAHSPVTGLVLLFVLFVALGAYFGGAESAFSAMNKIRIKSKADDGDRRAKNAVYIASNFDRALTTLLIGNNIAHIAAASIAAVIAARLFGTSDRVTFICTVVTTLVVFLFSEMIPKAFANDRSESASLFAANSLRLLMKLLYPLSAFFGMISSAFTRLAERVFPHKEEPSITEEELYDIIDTIEEEGVVDEEQGDLIKSAMEFSGTHAADVMTMRQDINAADASLPNEKLLEILRESTHSRLPVYEGDLDHILGLIHIRAFIREYMKNPAIDIRTLLTPAYRVSPDAMIDDLLTVMRQHKLYLAIVADAEGKTVGLVTIEDFLEELVGEIWDEDDVVDRDFIKLGGNRFRVTPRLTVGEIWNRTGTEVPAPAGADRPLLSLILEHFGRIPEEEESFLFDRLEITVEQVENGRIVSVEVHLLSDEELAEAHAVREKEKTGAEEENSAEGSLLSRLIRPRSEPDPEPDGGKEDEPESAADPDKAGPRGGEGA